MVQDRLTKKRYWEDIYSGKRQPKSARRRGSISRVLKRHLVYCQLDRIFKKCLPQKPELKFIEYGCGGSFWLPYFNIKFGYQVEGVDYSQTGCVLAQEQLQRFSSSGHILQEDFTKLGSDFENRHDICASFGVVEHFRNPQEIISKFFKTIKNGGIMITVIPNMTGIQGLIQFLINKEIFLLHNILSLDRLKSLHQKLGMEILYSGKVGFLTLGINFGKKAALLRKAYRLYSYCVSRLAVIFGKLFDWPVAGLWSSSYVVIARKKHTIDFLITNGTSCYINSLNKAFFCTAKQV